MDISVESSSSTLRRAAEPARLSPIVLAGLTALVEGALTALWGLALFHLYLGASIPEQVSRYEVAILIALQIQLAAFSNAHLYDLSAFRRPLQFAGRILLIWTVVFAALVVIAFLTKTSDLFSRLWLMGWYASGYVEILVFRFAFAGLLRRWTRAGRLERRVVIVGADSRGEQLIDALEAAPDSDVRICGVFDDRTDRVPDRVR